tara:strand:+ start:1114 stop:1875 length:762 start_codon:yes stop_codon:yes gene_type:complete
MINYSAIYSIIAFRLKEFFSDFQYSLIAPITTNLLFILVFLTIEGYYALSIDSSSFVLFIAPGLIIMIVAQESYDNPSATLVNMKQVGSLDDWLIAPVSRIEILISLIISTIIIGFIIAFFNLVIFSFIIDIQVYNFLFFCYYLAIVIVFFSSLGCIVGILFNTWDSQSTFSNFFVTPLNFLSGTFFSINYLPENLKYILYYNPYYYVVNFFRNCFNDDFTFQYIQNLYILFFIFFLFIITAYIYFKGYNIIK